jgi:hypothetical protein
MAPGAGDRMTRAGHDKIKQAARERMAETGEPYTLARRNVIAEREMIDRNPVVILMPSPELIGDLGGDLYSGGPAKIAAEGQKLQCKYNPGNPGHRMRFRDGAWEWDHE